MRDKKPKAAKAPKKQKSKKAKIVENKGITGEGTDYNVYIMSSKEKLIGVAAGFLLGYIAGYIYFNNSTVGLIVGLVAGYKGISIYRNKLFNDRKKELRLQFRDLLESLSNSLTVGKTSIGAFKSARHDMMAEHGGDAYITKELSLICDAYELRGMELNDLLNDFSVRSGNEDIRSFAGVFQVSTDLGGDIAKVVRETRDMISDKLEIELEIQTIVTGQKNQLNVLMVMPLVMSLLTRSFATDSGSAFVIIIKLLALGLFIFAYWLGSKIVDIKI